jgi:hypothetical protein
MWFTETQQQCRDDSATSADVYLMSAVDEPMFQLELAARLVASRDPPGANRYDAVTCMNRVLHQHSGKGVICD